MDLNKKILSQLCEKSVIKKQVFIQSLKLFQEIKKAGKQSIFEIKKALKKQKNSLEANFKNRNEFEFMIQFAGDVLIFQFHTNVFHFEPNHYI